MRVKPEWEEVAGVRRGGWKREDEEGRGRMKANSQSQGLFVCLFGR